MCVFQVARPGEEASGRLRGAELRGRPPSRRDGGTEHGSARDLRLLPPRTRPCRHFQSGWGETSSSSLSLPSCSRLCLPLLSLPAPSRPRVFVAPGLSVAAAFPGGR